MPTLVVREIMRRGAIVAGSTQVIVAFAAPVMLAWDTAGLAAEYKRDVETFAVPIPLVSAQLGRWKSGGFAGDTSTRYELGLPDNACLAGARVLTVSITRLVIQPGPPGQSRRVQEPVLGYTAVIVPAAVSIAEII